MNHIEMRGLKQGSLQWREWRDTGVGGSDAPVIMRSKTGGLYGKTALELWKQKMGYSEAKFTGVSADHIERGAKLEPLARAEFIRRTGIMIEPACLQSVTHPFMLASLDGINVDRDVIVEIKAPAEKMFKQMLEEGTPDYYQDQIQHQLYVVGSRARECYFWAFNPSVEPYVYLERHTPDYSRIQEIVREVSLFWKHVETGIAPDPGGLGVDKSRAGFFGLTMLAGYARAGKDTIGAVYKKLFGTTRFAFADPLKQMYIGMNGLSLDELEENKELHRPGLIGLGHGARQIDGNIWVNGIFKLQSGVYDAMAGTGAVVTDTRYINEASAGRKHAAELGVPFRLVWVKHPKVKVVQPTEAESTSLLEYVADIILVNDMDVKTPLGSLATDLAVVASLNVIPQGKRIEIAASHFEPLAEKQINESKRTANRRNARAKTSRR